MLATELPNKAELIARSEHLALAIETAFRERLLQQLAAGNVSNEELIKLMRINENFENLKIKKAMLNLKEQELALKKQIAAEKWENRSKEPARPEAVAKEKPAEPQESRARAKSNPQRSDEKSEPLPPRIDEAPHCSLEPTDEELLNMEWDLRTFLHFGDLRPFSWYTGLRTIYFPDRSGYPDPAVPNYPANLVRSPDMTPRPDGVFLLTTPLSELPEDWEKLVVKPRTRTDYTPVPAVLVNGQAQWQLFLQPAYPHTNFPYNTVLPAGWADGDPIPGMPEEFA